MRHPIDQARVGEGELKQCVQDLLERPIGAVLHLSDLHFGRDLFEKVDPKSWWEMGIKLLGELSMYCSSHEFNAVAALDEIYKSMQGNPKSHYLPSGAQAMLKPFDAVVVSGDMHNYAYGKHIFDSFSYTFLTSSIPISSRSSNTPFTEYDIGFRLPPNSLIAVPGNHDKLMSVHADNYNQSQFCATWWNVPCDYLKILRSHSGLRFAFLGIDSNKYVAPNLAMGEVSNEAIQALAAQLDKLDRDQASSEAPHIRVLVLHHSPYPADQLVTKKGGYLRLEGYDRLVDKVLCRVDVVLCGHFHEQEVRLLKGATVVKSGSATQWGVKNSFHTLIFCERNGQLFMVTVPYYLSGAGKFVARFPEADAYPLERARRFDSNSPPSAVVPPYPHQFYARPIW